MREQKGWDLLQASCRQPSFSIYLQTLTVRSPSACQDTHTYCTPLVLSICSFEILFVFLISIEFSDSSLYHTLRICACISESVCMCEWLLLKVFLIWILQLKRGHLVRDKRKWTFFFLISSLALWVISSLSLAPSSSLWCSPRLYLTEERLFLSCSSVLSVLFNYHPENIFITTRWEKEYSRLNTSKALSTASVSPIAP